MTDRTLKPCKSIAHCKGTHPTICASHGCGRLPSQQAKATMTLNLPPAEMKALDALAAELDMSKTAVMRHALRLYQAATHQSKSGAQIAFIRPDGSRVEPLLPMLAGGDHD